jgi:hypothetical protein
MKKIISIIIAFLFFINFQNIQAKELNRNDFLKVLTLIQNLKENPEIKKDVKLYQKILNIEKRVNSFLKVLATKPTQSIINEKINSILSKGISDKIANGDVKKLQKLLKNNGYQLKYIDGIFGNETEKALKKYTKDKLGYELNYYDPRLFKKNKNKISEKDYKPEKINEYLGYGKFDFFYLDFPFSKEKINSIYCGKAKKDYIFKNGKIIFPISKNGPGKFSCVLNAKLDGKNKSFEIVDVYFRTVKRPTTKVNLVKKYAKGPTTETQKRIARENKEILNDSKKQ